ncbi:MAG: RNA-binding protein [Bacteroidetes bacterium]|nr:RNA-binding protein [Bacteroidota bacterium]
MNIFISNLNYTTVESELQALFENYGTVDSAKIITDKETGRSRGFGFIEMPNDDEARAAIEGLNQTDYKQRTMNISEAKPREEKPRSFGNRGGYRDNNRGNRGEW